MNNFDRGIIKWQPFESLESSNQIIKSLILEKRKISKPILSEEEIAEIESKIIDAYYSKENITIYYYKGGLIKTIKTKITKIDHIYKMIYLNNKLRLFFKQIVAVKL